MVIQAEKCDEIINGISVKQMIQSVLESEQVRRYTGLTRAQCISSTHNELQTNGTSYRMYRNLTDHTDCYCTQT